jgi:hypothetical protein
MQSLELHRGAFGRTDRVELPEINVRPGTDAVKRKRLFCFAAMNSSRRGRYRIGRCTVCDQKDPRPKVCKPVALIRLLACFQPAQTFLDRCPHRRASRCLKIWRLEVLSTDKVLHDIRNRAERDDRDLDAFRRKRVSHELFFELPNSGIEFGNRAPTHGTRSVEQEQARNARLGILSELDSAEPSRHGWEFVDVRRLCSRIFGQGKSSTTTRLTIRFKQAARPRADSVRRGTAPSPRSVCRSAQCGDLLYAALSTAARSRDGVDTGTTMRPWLIGSLNALAAVIIPSVMSPFGFGVECVVVLRRSRPEKFGCAKRPTARTSGVIQETRSQ